MVVEIDSTGVKIRLLGRDGAVQLIHSRPIKVEAHNSHLIANIPFHRFPTVSRL
jgi:hypothetical protein